MEINIPNLGEGIESATVISILVANGDSVSKDQTLLELETDKAVAPVPAPADGTISSIIIKEGDVLKTGSLIGHYEGGSESSSQPTAPESNQAAPAPQVTPPTTAIQQQQQVAVPVVQPVSQSGVIPPCSPSLKKLALRIGLDLSRINPTGKNGRLTDQDVFNYVQYLQTLALNPQGSMPAEVVETKPKRKPLPDFSKFGPIEVKKLSSLRQKISEKMEECWTTIPHVTQQQSVNITELMALRKKYNPKYQTKNTKITLTVFAIKAVQKALEEFPHFNASFDQEKNELIQKNYYHIGIAVDTESGLIVPVIKDVDKKSVLELCQDLDNIAEKARNRSLSMEDLSGSTFTISNLGGLGVGAFTPIVNAPEVAILGISAGEWVPTFNKKGDLDKKLSMPICLSYDHRVIDGADGARFINKVKSEFEQFSEEHLKEL